MGEKMLVEMVGIGRVVGRVEGLGQRVRRVVGVEIRVGSVGLAVWLEVELLVRLGLLGWSWLVE